MNKTSQPSHICAIDASTNSLAFAFYTYKKLTQYGKINFEGKDIYQKCIDAAKKTQSLFNLDIFSNSSIVIEHAVFMNSPKTAADLAMIQGSIIGSAGVAGIEQMGKVSPITWQNYIGNKKMTKEEQLLIRLNNPDKSQAWYKNYERNIRKQRTINFININYDKKIDDNDVADACGIGHWALNNWGKAIGVDK